MVERAQSRYDVPVTERRHAGNAGWGAVFTGSTVSGLIPAAAREELVNDQNVAVRLAVNRPAHAEAE